MVFGNFDQCVRRAVMVVAKGVLIVDEGAVVVSLGFFEVV
jgi:hypothetical protein